jgi:general nucleoside transport system permease protein
MSLKERAYQLLKPFFSVILGLGLGLMVTKLAGENPWHVLEILGKSAFGSRYDVGMTLFYATPLIFTGLSVAIACHAGLFNVGAEGQLALGSLAAAAIGIYFPGVPFPLAPLISAVLAFLIGGLWGAIPGWLRARRGSHEVINTIMFNFISAGICSWITLYLLKSPDTQNPETSLIGTNYLIPQITFFGEAPVSISLFIALAVAVLVWFFLEKTVLGYELRAVGQNERAASAAGIDVAKIRILAMALAGGLAGFVGIGEVLGNAGKFILGFSPGYGFIGIAVALLGRNHPFGVVASALLFGALHKGSSDLDFETEAVTRDLSQILQAMVILCVSADGLWGFLGDHIQALMPTRKRSEKPRSKHHPQGVSL